MARPGVITVNMRELDRLKTVQAATCRKILIGAAMLAKAERGAWLQDKLLAMLDSTLTRSDDPALFDLPTPATEPVDPPNRIRVP